MSLLAAPFGLAPVAHPSGIVRPAMGSGGGQPLGGYTIASGLATNIFQNAPIQVDATTPAGNIVLVAAQGANGATAAANKILGSFQGVEFTLATGRRTVSNFWPASTVPFTGTQTVAWITRDPAIVYEIQANGSIAASQLGMQASITANGTSNGNTTTGFSTVALDTTGGNITTAAGQFNQLRIVGFSQRVDNNPGDAFTIVQVTISAHQDVVPGPAY